MHYVQRRDEHRAATKQFTRLAGMAHATGKALAVVPGDLDDDGDVDLYVANDHVPNFLWRNDGAIGAVE